MRKIISVVLVGLMIIGMMGYIQAVAQEGNDLEELIGLKVNIVYTITGVTLNRYKSFFYQGIIIEVKRDWLIVQEKNGIYIWCYIPTIRGIEILDKNYEPEGD